MSWLDGLRHRLHAILDPGGYEAQLREEMQLHEDLDRMQLGDASAARRRFGNRTWYQEEARRMTSLARFDPIRQDLAYAWRSVRRSPGFTVMVVLTLALGVGLNAATFSVIDQLYLRPPAAVAHPGEVRRVWIESFRVAGRTSSTGEAVNFPMFRAAAAAYGDTSRFAAVTRISDLRLGGTRAGPLVDIVYATSNYFDVLGIRPLLGRFFTGAEDQIGAPRTIVVSHALWRTHLGADSSIVGRAIVLDTTRFTVLGVAPEGFTGIDIDPAHLWTPMRTYPQMAWLQGKLFESERMYIFRGFYRRASARPDGAFERLASLRLRELSRQHWPVNPDTLLNVLTGPVLEARGPGDAGQEFIITTRLGGVAIIVLLIACANVVNLLLARATDRRREIAVRLALGISRARLVRLLTTETVLLALLAATAALLTAWWGGGALRALLLPEVEWTGSAMHWRVIVFTIGVAVAAGALAGLIPALQFSNPRLTRALKDGVDAPARRRFTLRSSLLVTQAALSVMLLAGAGLFVRSLRNVQEIDIGYDAGQLLFGRVAFDPGQAPPFAVRAEKVRAVQERLIGRPGVEGAALAGLEPMRGLSFKTFYWGSDSSHGIRKDFPTYMAVTPGFFRVAGIRLVRGRLFDAGAAGSHQVMINDAMAKQLWPDRDALGECLRFGTRDASCHVVTGIVETVNQRGVIESPQPQYYLPAGSSEAPEPATALVVRARAGGEAVAAREVASLLQQEFPAGYPVVTPMLETLQSEYRPWKVGAALFTGCGLLALAVVLVGIYSSISYSVSQRRREFGVRMALGAQMKDILHLVLTEGLRVVLVGIAVGIGLGLAAGKLIAALLFGVQPNDPSTMLMVSSALLTVAGLAALMPAWRASRVDPAVSLRAD